MSTSWRTCLGEKYTFKHLVFLYICPLVRSTRGTRRELERFVREVRRSNPGARVKMDYDKVEVGARSYVFDCEEGRVVQRDQVGIRFGCKIYTQF